MASLKKGGTPVRKGQSQLRSPLIKRSPTAPVTLQGWLHKQGSDGLMLWKKRWFVLSDFCLFYYKGPEEEKLLGSFLLASYMISPCSAEDKVYRKYSFKAEHANMRTYYFAADNQALMAQWMNALSLASILQDSWNEKTYKPNKDLDCAYLANNCGISRMDPQSNRINVWEPSQFQPLYANAPPKPRRLNEASSPERSPDRRSEEGRVSRLAQPQTKLYYQKMPLPPAQSNNAERRTPDTYGRSKSAGVPPTQGKVVSSKPRSSDYEDVYKRQDAYQQVRYRNPPNTQQPNVVVEPKRFPPRPHSADFLDYDGKREYVPQQPLHYTGTFRPQRPKSSLDVVYSNDSIHWSEEGYARKMRQSSLYVSPQLQNVSNSSRSATRSMRHSQMSPTGNYSNTNELASTIMKTHSEAIKQQERRWSEYLDSRENQFVRSASARLPRPQKEEKIDDDTSDKSSVVIFKRRNSTDSRDSTTKIQQREESMKRLLEWKQRMLQSPLTRKSSGSSNRGTAQNELSKYYKQQVLREMTSKDSRSGSSLSRKEVESSYRMEPVSPHNFYGESSRRNGAEMKKWDGLDGGTLPNHHEIKVYRRRSDEPPKMRSRSQDGRNSVSRYNSYSSDEEGSGSGSVIGRDPLPARQLVIDNPPAPNPNNLSDTKRTETWNLNVSAGELLGRTHEELVLLLIQLRRQSAGLCKAMEDYHREIEAQARLTELDTPKRIEHLKKLDDLRRHLLDLEKQYEKGKPLVNLVDNMVKLGSLYRAGSTSGPVPQRLEFNHKVQEQRLLAEERRDWERISPDHNQLQAKVEQLYRLDRLLQEESGTLQSLQQDKEMLERALGGLRHKLQGLHGNPAETERYKRQQRMLEKELTRVRSILAQNSKKLEETVAENARLEQELVVLRQKLQWSRRSAEPGGTTTATLEAELRRVQLLVGDLQRQRQELSLQVRQLTEKSHTLSQQIRPGPTGVAGASAISAKKRAGSSWLETDLDSQITHDIGLETPCSSPPQLTPSISPLYVNTEPGDKALQEKNSFDGNTFNDDSSETVASPTLAQTHQFCRTSEVNEADDKVKRYYGLVPKEKPQEIKTVRIVKRESERRQRDRDRSGCLGIPLTNSNSKRVTIIEETINPDNSEKDALTRGVDDIQVVNSEVIHGMAQTNGPPPTPGPRSDSVIAVKNIVNRQNLIKNDNEIGKMITAREQLFGGSEGSPQLSPVYLSEAARQIVEEVAWRGRGGRRLIPKEKRRHHTVSGQPVIRHHAPYSPGGSRDDLDMERALRPRLNTPDVVRSTLSRTDPKFTTETIDSVLGTPGKILIPERYIPESGPQLSKEELQKRSKKADAIRKMLSETTAIAPVKPNEAEEEEEEDKSSTLKKKVAEEKRQREHLLQLNQILAQQVMEKSKIVAGVNPTVTQE